MEQKEYFQHTGIVHLKDPSKHKNISEQHAPRSDQSVNLAREGAYSQPLTVCLMYLSWSRMERIKVV